jgi:MtN3 and saliva related transmembrane protein
MIKAPQDPIDRSCASLELDWQSGSFLWMDLVSNVLGGLAALLTTVANVPQVIKCIRTGESADLSLKMLLTLALGLLFWFFYGVMRSDFIIAAANGASLCLVGVFAGLQMARQKPRVVSQGRSATSSAVTG